MSNKPIVCNKYSKTKTLPGLFFEPLPDNVPIQIQSKSVFISLDVYAPGDGTIVYEFYGGLMCVPFRRLDNLDTITNDIQNKRINPNIAKQLYQLFEQLGLVQPF